MRITNRLGLPDAIVEAVRNDPYDPGVGDITATGLISPPRQKELQRRHSTELEEDASDRIWALLGQAVHTILERAEPSALTEKRLYGHFGDWSISGQFDRLHVRDGVLQDYKVTNLWSIKDGAKEEWLGQMNILAELCVRNGYGIRRLEVVALLRNWSKREAERTADYPPRQVEVIDIPLWPVEQRIEFILERIRLHKAARVELPECSEKERWERAKSWAVMKEGNKRATKVFNMLMTARLFTEEQRGKGRFEIQERPGEQVRCESYCSVSRFCEQAKSLGVGAVKEAAA